MKQPTACVAGRATGFPAMTAASASARSRCRRRRPLDAEIDMAIVDPAAIDDAAASVDRGLGRHRRANELDERVRRIPERLGRAGVRERRHVLANLRRRLGGVRVDQPERDALRPERFGDPADFRRVAIRDRAVRAREEKDDRLRARRRLKGIHGRTRQRLNEHGQQREEDTKPNVHKKGRGFGGPVEPPSPQPLPSPSPWSWARQRQFLRTSRSRPLEHAADQHRRRLHVGRGAVVHDAAAVADRQ